MLLVNGAYNNPVADRTLYEPPNSLFDAICVVAVPILIWETSIFFDPCLGGYYIFCMVTPMVHGLGVESGIDPPILEFWSLIFPLDTITFLNSVVFYW